MCVLVSILQGSFLRGMSIKVIAEDGWGMDGFGLRETPQFKWLASNLKSSTPNRTAPHEKPY